MPLILSCLVLQYEHSGKHYLDLPCYVLYGGETRHNVTKTYVEKKVGMRKFKVETRGESMKIQVGEVARKM